MSTHEETRMPALSYCQGAIFEQKFFPQSFFEKQVVKSHSDDAWRHQIINCSIQHRYQEFYSISASHSRPVLKMRLRTTYFMSEEVICRSIKLLDRKQMETLNHLQTTHGKAYGLSEQMNIFYQHAFEILQMIDKKIPFKLYCQKQYTFFNRDVLN